ncbi:hypothetical protein KY290_033646 [Solanum tuberosum]|uniref:Uncharacterized protein n=1 Tax=Solanum tuberosum TaxID=4113 RepID=A0ABQ7U2A8_SOLTU|nr:hypothetical protein KY289_033018 [Solanum tuberosum]KAH0647659.1 hypothetical protein KY285_032907 [Solanum tuberosum]KAH0740603.1 hypothetical protein KY290_033646 [Solanum tuberosum]
MAEVENHSSPPSDPAPSDPSTPHPQNGFNPSRMIGIIRRKAMIKDLAAIYHAECLAYCQELLELQKKAEEKAPTFTCLVKFMLQGIIETYYSDRVFT